MLSSLLDQRSKNAYEKWMSTTENTAHGKLVHLRERGKFALESKISRKYRGWCLGEYYQAIAWS